MRLSKEREADLRKHAGNADVWCSGLVTQDLFAEIDALRAELDDTRGTRLAIKLGRLEIARDELKAENDKLKLDFSSKFQEQRHENVALLAENARLAVKCERQEQALGVTRVGFDAAAIANQELRERIVKLREALLWYNNEYNYDEHDYLMGVDSGHVGTFRAILDDGFEVARKAFNADNEMERGK